MTPTRTAVVAILALLAGSVGCVNVRYQASQEAILPCPPNDVPPLQRKRVYLFMMNGLDVFETAGMLDVRDRLAVAGFPGVYYAQRPDRAWYYREMHRLRCDEPEARFLLLSYGAGAENIQALAFDAARDGLPVDAVVFLDPVGVSGDLNATLPFHSVVVRSHHWVGSPGLSAREHIDVPYFGHLSLPRSPATHEILVRLMSASAERVQLPGLEYLPRLELRARPEPTPRPIDPATLVSWPPGADFLSAPQPFPTLPWDGCCPRAGIGSW